VLINVIELFADISKTPGTVVHFVPATVTNLYPRKKEPGTSRAASPSLIEVPSSPFTNHHHHHCQSTTMKKLLCVVLVSSLLLATLAGASSSSLASSIGKQHQAQVLGRKGRDHYQHLRRNLQQPEVSPPKNLLKLHLVNYVQKKIST
jgi:hypothetical protein